MKAFSKTDDENCIGDNFVEILLLTGHRAVVYLRWSARLPAPTQLSLAGT